MASFNKIRVVGQVGRDSELVYKTFDLAMVRFPVPLIERWTDLTGAEREHATCFQVQLWGNRAEGLCQILTKGSTYGFRAGSGSSIAPIGTETDVQWLS